MSSRRANSFQNWCLTGTLAGSLILGGTLFSQAGPPRFVGRSGTKTDSQKMIAERQQSAILSAAYSEEQGSENATVTTPSVEQQIAQKAKHVRLNFMESSWKSVLASYAEQAGVELVADPTLIPRDRFTRRDRSLYSSAEALNILNRDLMRFDVKLVQKGNQLVLKDLPSAGPQYRRPVVHASGLVTDHKLPESTVSPTWDLRKTPRRIVDSEVETADAKAVSISTDAAEIPAGRIQLTAATETREVSPQSATLMSVHLTHRRTKDISNALYHAFQKNADLVADGPEGLPAIRVYNAVPKTKQAVGKIALAPPKRTLKFTIAMDHANSRMTIQAPAATARAVASMVQKLDVPGGPRTNVQLFASDYGDRVESVAEMVQKQLTRISKARNRAPSMDNALAFQGNAAQPANEDVENQSQPADQPEETPANPQRGRGAREAIRTPKGNLNVENGGEEAAPPDLTGGLKGDVSVESVPDLGIMILRGNQKDVEAVMEIIREIEKLSAGTTPDVHLLMLKNTNSEALAELLTQVYEKLNGRRRPATGNQPAGSGSQSVTIIPVVTPNAILIVAAEADMDAILRLADELDQPIDPQAEFQMFRLKSGIAEQVLQTIQTFFEERSGLGPRVLAVADVRTNAILVYARPSDLKQVDKLIKELDQLDSAAVSQVRFFPLKNAVATETALVLQQTLQSVMNPPSTNQGGGKSGGLTHAGWWGRWGRRRWTRQRGTTSRQIDRPAIPLCGRSWRAIVAVRNPGRYPHLRRWPDQQSGHHGTRIQHAADGRID